MNGDEKKVRFKKFKRLISFNGFIVRFTPFKPFLNNISRYIYFQQSTASALQD